MYPYFLILEFFNALPCAFLDLYAVWVNMCIIKSTADLSPSLKLMQTSYFFSSNKVFKPTKNRSPIIGRRRAALFKILVVGGS